MIPFRSLDDIDRIVLDRLERRYTRLALPLHTVLDRAEEYIAELVHELVMGRLEAEASKSATSFSLGQQNRLSYGEAWFALSVGIDQTDGKTLDVVVRRIDGNGADLIKKACYAPVGPYGRCNRIAVRTDALLLAVQEPIAESAARAVSAAYRWLTEYVRQFFGRKRASVADDLYSHLRRIFAGDVTDSIWLYCFSGTDGIYLPDAGAREVAMKRAAGAREITSAAPLSTVVDFLTRTMDLEDTAAAQYALAQGDTVDVRLGKVPYVQTGFQFSEEAIISSDQCSVQPLVREGKSLMVAVYPTALRPQIERTLATNQEDLEKILRTGTSSLNRAVRTLRESGVFAQLPEDLCTNVGEFVGGFIGGFLKSLKSG